MTISEVLSKYKNTETELLLAQVLRKPKEFVFLHPRYPLTKVQYSKLSNFVQRRQQGEPIAYILGYKDFFGLRFKVNKDVLIPRPETEWVVDKVYQVIKSKVGEKFSVLDVGTGSGAIAISLAKHLESENWKVKITASDISPAALKVAKANAKTHKAKIKFIKSDLFKNITGKYDIIVANLPYVPKMIYDMNFEQLKYEPVSALTDGTKSFQIYRRFFEQVGGFVNKGATILLEIDPSSKKFLQEYKEKFLPSAKMKFHRDFNRFWRFAEVKI